MSRESRTRLFVISMRGSTERRAAFTERARDARVPWRFFDGSDGPTPELIYDDGEVKARWGRSLTPGEIGCYASHLSLWNRLLEDEADQYLILEDDVIVDWKFLEKLLTVDFHRSGVDYLRLHCLRPGAMRVVKYGYCGTRQLIQLREPAYGTQGYVITRAGARRLSDYCRRVIRPIDSQLDRYWEHGIPNLCLFPFPIIEESGESLIGDQRREWPKRPLGARLGGKLRGILDDAKRRAWLLSRSIKVTELCDFSV